MVRYFFSARLSGLAALCAALALSVGASPASASDLDRVIPQAAIQSSFDLAQLSDIAIESDGTIPVDGSAPPAASEDPLSLQSISLGTMADASGKPDLAPAPAMLSIYGPSDDQGGASPGDPRRFRSFGSQVGAVKWEVAAIFGYYTAINGKKLFHDPTWPHFHKEGFFGTDTNNLGVDKIAHGYSAYILSELLHARLRRKTDDAPGIEYTAAALASATMLYTELWDSIEKTSGWSWEDVAFNTLGSGFSIVRNSVPGLDRKLDFRLTVIPNSSIFNAEGKRHFEQQRYFFALKLSGFKAFEHSPMRLMELHLGYYGKDFTKEDRAQGIRPKRRVFVGVGINLRELFFRDSDSRVGRAVGDALDYFTPPYTSINTHLTN